MFSEENWLNVNGLVIYQNKLNRKLFAERTYHWVDRIVIIDESQNERLFIGQCNLSQFDKDGWTVITKEEFRLIKSNYSEINQIRRDLKINQIL